MFLSDLAIYHHQMIKKFYTKGENWSWDSNTSSLANGPRHILTNFSQLVSFISAKELLEPMRPLVKALQGQLVEVYFGFLIT